MAEVALKAEVRQERGKGPARRLRASGKVLRSPGFLAVYREAAEEDSTEEAEGTLPPVTEGETLKPLEIYSMSSSASSTFTVTLLRFHRRRWRVALLHSLKGVRFGLREEMLRLARTNSL